MFGQHPRLSVDLLFGTGDICGPEGNSSGCHKEYVDKLKASLKNAYELAATKSAIKKKHQKQGYDLRTRAAVLQEQDHVLIRNVAFSGPHKLADRWQDEVYVVLSQPDAAIPVYVVQQEGGKGPKKTLHRNLLLPISSCSNDTLPVAPKPLPVAPKTNPVSPNAHPHIPVDTEAHIG